MSAPAIMNIKLRAQTLDQVYFELKESLEAFLPLFNETKLSFTIIGYPRNLPLVVIDVGKLKAMIGSNNRLIIENISYE